MILFVRSESTAEHQLIKHKTVLKIKRQYTEKDRMKDEMIHEADKKRNAEIA